MHPFACKSIVSAPTQASGCELTHRKHKELGTRLWPLLTFNKCKPILL